MPLRIEVYRAFGVNHASLTRKGEVRLSRRDLASLIVSSFLICSHLYQGQNFGGVSNPSLVVEIERSIESNNAYDPSTGNVKPKSIDDLAQTISTIPSLTIFGDNLIYKSFISDVYHAVRLSSVVGKSPLETLEALSEFEYKINRVGKATLDHENIHYMAAIPRRRVYSYAFNPDTGTFLVADERTTPIVMVGLDQAANWFGGRLHIQGNVISVDAEAGDVQRDPQKVVNYLGTQFGRTGFQFEIQTEKILNSKGETFNEVWERRKSYGPLGRTSDPREWPVEAEEQQFAREYSLMSLVELEEIFRNLISGEQAIIESSQHYLNEASPLIAFLDNLSNSPLEIDHHFRSPFGRIKMLKDATEFSEQRATLTEEREARYTEMLSNTYRYKAFLRELMIRWDRD